MKSFWTIAAWWRAVLSDRERLAGRFVLAEEHAGRALQFANRGGFADTALAASILNRLGMIEKYRGRYRESAHAYRRALRLAKRHLSPDHPLIATLYHNLGGLAHARGRYATAETFARHGLTLRVRACCPDHPDVAKDHAALAAILDGLGRHEEAVSLHLQALATFERKGGRGASRETAYTLANLAACLHQMGRNAEAHETARRAAELQSRILGRHHPDTALTLANLAVIYDQTVRTARTRAHSRTASPAQRTADPPNTSCIGV